MKQPSTRLSTSSTTAAAALVCAAACGLLGSGCESLQQKFVRKRKTPLPAPTPIVQFEDYSRAFTPLDRYRKHAVLFDYWNNELLEALNSRSLNAKRLRRASADSLAELRVLQGLLEEHTADRMAPLVKDRDQLNEQLQRGVFNDPQARLLEQQADVHGRRLHQEFSWRDVQDKLKP